MYMDLNYGDGVFFDDGMNWLFSVLSCIFLHMTLCVHEGFF